MSSDYQMLSISEDNTPDAISPEGAKIANTYLLNFCSTNKTAKILNMSNEQVAGIINQPMVKQYIIGIMRESGHQHMTKIMKTMDTLIDKKLEELEEAEIGSNKDIADLLQMAHKMQLDIANLLQRDVAKQGPSSQTNVQVNSYGEGNYGRLMEKLIKG